MLESAAWPPDRDNWNWRLLGLRTPELSDSCIQWPSAQSLCFLTEQPLNRLESSPHVPQLLVTLFFTLAWASRTG